MGEVDCRIGSLENKRKSKPALKIVDCRIGSLENKYTGIFKTRNVDCRIGSLENIARKIDMVVIR